MTSRFELGRDLSIHWAFHSRPFHSCSLSMFSWVISDGYTSDDLQYEWKESDPIQIVRSLHLPEFSLQAINPSRCDVLTATGDGEEVNISTIANAHFHVIFMDCRKIQLSQCGIRAGEVKLASLQSLLLPFDGFSCSLLDRLLDSHRFGVCWVQGQVGYWVCFDDFCPDGLFVWIRLSKPSCGLQHRYWWMEGTRFERKFGHKY